MVQNEDYNANEEMHKEYDQLESTDPFTILDNIMSSIDLLVSVKTKKSASVGS